MMLWLPGVVSDGWDHSLQSNVSAPQSAYQALVREPDNEAAVLFLILSRVVDADQ